MRPVLIGRSGLAAPLKRPDCSLDCTQTITPASPAALIMTLDLQEVIADWNAEPGEISARLIVGRDGGELLQLRVDLGLMQMFPEGRPDGKRHHGLPNVLDYVEHVARLGRVQVAEEDARELQRELYQMNYRRLASSSLVEDCLMHKDVDNARRHVERALREIDGCLRRIDALSAAADPAACAPPHADLPPRATTGAARF